MTRVDGKTIALDVVVSDADRKKLIDTTFWAEYLEGFVSHLDLTYIKGLEELIPGKTPDEPGGVSATCILLESHCSVHCWGELNYFRLELSSCREDINSDIVCGIIEQEFDRPRISVSTMDWNGNNPANDDTIFGWHIVLDLVDCNENVSDANAIKGFSERIVKEIDMIPYGAPIVEYFGEKSEVTKGYTLVQLIETSAIMGHFSDFYKSAHLDIFSCKPYDLYHAVEYARSYFGGKIHRMERIVRYCR